MPIAETTNPAATSRNDAWLIQHRRNVHSQCGEDGVLEKIFEVLGEGDKWCVEFGAWDGKHFSNTRQLIAERGWSGVLIEGDEARYQDLAREAKITPGIVPLHAFVGYDGPDTLDKLLARTAIPQDFSLLSIDIDGNDYHVWDAFKNYQPRAVVIEFNVTIPPDIDFVQARDMAVSQGSSLKALTRLAQSKGYELVAATDWNGFFVRKDLFGLFGIQDNRPETLWKDRQFDTRLFQLYDGTVVLAGCDRLLWHGVTLDISKVGVPAWLRVYRGRMTKTQQRLLKLWRRFKGRKAKPVASA
jgi:hypothetical protein